MNQMAPNEYWVDFEYLETDLLPLKPEIKGFPIRLRGAVGKGNWLHFIPHTPLDTGETSGGGGGGGALYDIRLVRLLVCVGTALCFQALCFCLQALTQYARVY